MRESDSILKNCPHCGRLVLRSGASCPYCDNSLDDTSRANGRQEAGRIESRNSSHPKPYSAERRISRLPVLVFFALVAGTLGLFVLSSFSSNRALITKPEKLSDAFPLVTEHPQDTGGTSALKGDHESKGMSSTGSDAESAATGATDIVTAQNGLPDRSYEREKEIRRVFNEVLKDFEKKQVITADTVHMKSGETIQCTIIGETDTRLKIRLNNIAITVEKEKVERVEHRTSEAVTQELRRLALAQATKIVDEGLVRNGGQWVPREQTAEYKFETFRSFLRAEKASSTNLLGGELWLYPETGAAQSNASNSASFHAFRVTGKKLDLGKVCDLFPSPIKASGECDAEMSVKLDERDLTVFSGSASFNGEGLTVSPVDAGIFALPTNRQATLNAKLSAGGGKIFIENFTVSGKAYDLSGGGVILFSSRPEHSRVDLSFSVVFKEAPTVKDRQLVAMGAKQYVDGLVAARTEVPLKLAGPLKRPKIEPVPGSALDSLLKQAGR